MADLGNISKIQLVNGDVAHFQDLVSGYTNNTGTITGIKMNGSSKGTSGVVDLGTVITAHQDISGKADKSATVSTIAWDSTNNKLTKTINGTTTDVVTIATIKSALALPDPMIFKGSLGTGGTITSLPTAAASNKGHTYKVITAGTYASQAAKVGDTFISDGSAWVLIPSGDEPSGTVTSVAISGGDGISVSGSPITSSGTITLGLKLGYTTSGNDRAVQADSNGNLYVTQKDNNTTYSAGTGLSLSSNTFSVKLGYTTSGNNRAVQADSNGNLYVTQKDDNTNYYHTTGSWSGLTYTATANGGAGALALTLPTGTTSTTVAVGNHTHATSIETSSDTNQITLAYGTKYVLKAGGTSYVFTMPASDNTNTHRPIQMNGSQILGDNTTALNLKAGTNVSLSNSSGTVTIAATDTTYSRQTPASGGTTLSLVNTGDMYTWNNKSSATNWLNGSQTGSVRTSGSATEDSSYTIGSNAVAEGFDTEASGEASHAEGRLTIASKLSAHAEGYSTTASGQNSHAEGVNATASGSPSHAEGYYTTASGYYSHAEGYYATASGESSHAEGANTTASGYYSHAGGNYTIAQRKSQTAIGEYNISDTTGADRTVRGSYAFIIGNGTAASARSNALTVDWDGNVTSYNTKFNLKNYQTSGSTDKAIYDKVVNLGWSDVLS